MVWVSADAKVKVAGEVTDLVRLLKVVEPVIVWLVPSKTTVELVLVKVPVFVQLPATFMVVLASVPLVALRVPEMVMVPAQSISYPSVTRVSPVSMVNASQRRSEARVVVSGEEPMVMLPRLMVPVLSV